MSQNLLNILKNIRIFASRLLQLRLWNLNSTSNFPVALRRLSCQISANQREGETSANVNKHQKTCAWVMTSLLMSSPPISILHRLFRCRYSNSRDLVASSPSFSRPAARAPRTACSQASSKATNTHKTNRNPPIANHKP